MTKRWIWALMVCVLLPGISACGSKGEGAQAELATIDAIMQQAINLGADELAPVELRVAREKQRLAYAAMEDKKYSKAQMLSREAKVDAQLAGALATAVKTRYALKSIIDDSLAAPAPAPAPQAHETSASQIDSLRALIRGN